MPECSRVYLWSRSGTGLELRNQRTDGGGSPVARHCSRAMLLIGSVWFCGPWWIIGAGRRSSSTISKRKLSPNSTCSGVNGSVTLGDGLTQKGRYPGGQKSTNGVQGRKPNRGSSGRTPKLIIILEMDVKLELVLSTDVLTVGGRDLIVLGAGQLSS